MRLIIFADPGFKTFLIFGCFLNNRPLGPLMTCCRYLLDNFIVTHGTNLFPASGLLTGCVLHSLPIAVAVTGCRYAAGRTFLDYITGKAVNGFRSFLCAFRLFVRRVIGIPGVPPCRNLHFTAFLNLIAFRTMNALGSRLRTGRHLISCIIFRPLVIFHDDDTGLCLAANCAGKSLYACFCAGRFFSDNAPVPLVAGGLDLLRFFFVTSCADSLFQAFFRAGRFRYDIPFAIGMAKEGNKIFRRKILGTALYTMDALYAVIRTGRFQIYRIVIGPCMAICMNDRILKFLRPVSIRVDSSALGTCPVLDVAVFETGRFFSFRPDHLMHMVRTGDGALLFVRSIFGTSPDFQAFLIFSCFLNNGPLAPVVSCRGDFFFLNVIASFALIGYNAGFCAGRFFGHIFHHVVKRMAQGKQSKVNNFSTILALISVVTVFRAGRSLIIVINTFTKVVTGHRNHNFGSLFDLSAFRAVDALNPCFRAARFLIYRIFVGPCMYMTCRRNDFRPCFSAHRAGIRLYPVIRISGFLCYDTVIPHMSCRRNLFRFSFVTYGTGVSKHSCLFTGRFFSDISFVPLVALGIIHPILCYAAYRAGMLIPAVQLTCFFSNYFHFAPTMACRRQFHVTVFQNRIACGTVDALGTGLCAGGFFVHRKLRCPLVACCRDCHRH